MLSSADALTEDIDAGIMLTVLAQVKGGDFAARMPLDWSGLAGEIARSVNDVIIANQSLEAELARVSQVVGTEGKLSQRLMLGGWAQSWSGSAASVNSLLRRARAAFESRLPAAGRERAPLPDSRSERETIDRFAESVENGDIDELITLLTEDAWLTMPPLPHAYQGRDAIGAFLRGAEERRGAPMRLLLTRANTQPAFACYVSAPDSDGARAFALFVLTLAGSQISAITWFAGADSLAQFGLPPVLR